ncbi:hypothetical protein F511_35353 [Dorcoceras hygrometricum]|uniref:Splicing factor 3B subunit 1-like n=1 Tax=Dorcoceras hygrometricum TaxID=472368 RepID=A0A2Z7BQE6_9LAMI|nr:hypothetical protein F511_35353 [Dorcoceras hygrometricum]
MVASLIHNALQVNFDSVLSLPDEGTVQMFKALESTGLRGFLGCHSVLNEDDLMAFFSYSFVRENEVISCVQGNFVGISEEVLAASFELPTEGLTSMDEVSKDLIYDVRSVFFASGEPVKTSCKKKEMKIEFRLLNDILEKSVTVKSKILFDILRDMVTKSSKQAKGFAAICVLLKGAPNLKMGEAKTFPPLKILTLKTIGTYVAKNKSITAEEMADEPSVEKFVKKAAAKRRPAPAAEPVAKRKSTTVGRAAPTEKNLAIVPVRVSDDEKPDVEEIFAKVIAETAEIVEEEPVLDTVEKESRIDVSAITNYDADISFKVLSNEEGPLIIESKDTEPLSKVLELTETSISDEESMYIDDILQQILEEMMLPSVMAEEPTKIIFGHGIAFREVNWYKASLPQIDADAKGKEPLVEEIIKGNPAKEMFSLICADIDFLVQLREAVLEEIYSFFSSFSLHRLSVLESVSDLAAKEEQVLLWAETDSLQTAARRCLYITTKYREMLLRKFLEARHQNSESSTPTTQLIYKFWTCSQKLIAVH